ncbi:carbohydrate kinase [Streptomyces capoamus]|uniref:Carbohydrate kinase n=1 Tax=Streptomyces capoamus TaxID=68183 RepID=A0A919C294_9ACTN|nr:sugar kinase [Streptomyces capoamus]GGW17553.1 carbohydrate kinase [Streptomyces libani subsp. rufus]GHG36437.1 carbohydrate kinase [Streptomyces capoamus]
MDVATLGESMVAFLPGRPGRLADVPSFDRSIGGAESNVACALAASGHTTRWIGRVGADGFGDHLVERIAAYGVDVTAVRRDPARPTGVYFRTAGDRGTGAHEVAYYRAGSAASAMSVTGVDLAAARAARVLHLTGITAALSAECRTLLDTLTAPAPGRPMVSFDVNHRPGLWTDDEDPRLLLDLARRADIVFVGADEAREAWGLHGGSAIVRALPEPALVVVKQGRSGATAFHRHTDAAEDADGTATPVRAPRVDVVSHTGAGDAFAAGFLSATLRGLPLRTRLRHGHLFAAAALTSPADLAPPPARDHADRLAALDDDAWGRLRLGPGWTQAEQAPEEANTP